ncbi:MAG: methylated-DNA--[protein]-cysteine S-methyltransferase [Clostridium sp.]|uniref:methylated-DNA--[protein]-cysteine S-methyltransferase n=1 Tax=Clostridium sp. TaxID=1506 RepID=UPI002911B473|nr:methylated-DNA--[protein]-cysteine S-methyltransferase [Clostridium sp.]MDU4938749.1 methylated-DNA--[protein]-cysteine S-methyltransferase [Clostridium sp.]
MKYGYYKSPIGIIEIKEEDGYIISTGFVETMKSEDESEAISRCKIQLEEYFKGKRKNFDIKIKYTVGTEFQRKVWDKLKEISYGKTVSYKHIAKEIGNEKASRAVGGANNKNPIGIIIPCHRVVGSNSKLVGYAGGLDKKQYLLELESKHK